MKLSKLKEKLELKNLNKRKIKKEYQYKSYAKKEKPVIIGITGSRGKSTTALMIHNYLKGQGHKSVLYSSIMVDSPASHFKENEAYEVVLKDEDSLISIIEEAEAYEAEYLILEVNESALEKGILKDVPFDVRVLTNLNSKHNLEQYTENEYVNLKKSFFKDVNDDCKIVLGFQDYDKSLLDELLQLNNYPKYIASSNYIANQKGVRKDDIYCLLTDLESNITGMTLKFNLEGKACILRTNLLMNHNALNILTAITTLKVIGELNISEFEKHLNTLVVPGRAETIYIKDRLIVIDMHLPAMLEYLENLKQQNKINKIKVVIGSMGYGFKYWDDKFKTQEFASQRKQSRKFAMSLLKNAVDYVYLTESDSGKENAYDICLELQKNLDNVVPSEIIVDREKAIKTAILNSQVGDVIFISGRGNKRILCNGKSSVKLIKDSDVVQKTLIDLGW